MATTDTAVRHEAFYIGGEWVEPTGSETHDVINASTEELIATIPLGTPEDVDDAVAAARARRFATSRRTRHSVYGLAGGVWSADPERAKRVARRLRTGMVEINGGVFYPLAPCGGYKQSGNGRELGSHGLVEFTETKALRL